MHLGLEFLDANVTSGDGGRGPVASGQDDEGIEDLLVEAGRGGERVVASMDRRTESVPERGFSGEMVFEMGHAVGDVTRFVLEGEVRDLGGDRVGSVTIEEREEVQEAAFAEHGEQERRQDEVGLVEQGLE